MLSYLADGRSSPCRDSCLSALRLNILWSASHDEGYWNSAQYTAEGIEEMNLSNSISDCRTQQADCAPQLRLCLIMQCKND